MKASAYVLLENYRKILQGLHDKEIQSTDNFSLEKVSYPNKDVNWDELNWHANLVQKC